MDEGHVGEVQAASPFQVLVLTSDPSRATRRPSVSHSVGAVNPHRPDSPMRVTCLQRPQTRHRHPAAFATETTQLTADSHPSYHTDGFN